MPPCSVSYKTTPSRPLATLSGVLCLCALALNRLLPECSLPLSQSQQLLPPRTRTHCVPLPWENESFITDFISRISTRFQGCFSLFVSKSSIVRQTKQWLYFVICTWWDLTWPRPASPSTPSASVTAHQPSIFSRGSRDIPERDPSGNSSC